MERFKVHWFISDLINILSHCYAKLDETIKPYFLYQMISHLYSLHQGTESVLQLEFLKSILLSNVNQRFVIKFISSNCLVQWTKVQYCRTCLHKFPHLALVKNLKIPSWMASLYGDIDQWPYKLSCQTATLSLQPIIGQKPQLFNTMDI